MEGLISVDVAKARHREFMKEAEHDRWLEDAHTKGLETTGPVTNVVKATLIRLATMIGSFAV